MTDITTALTEKNDVVENIDPGAIASAEAAKARIQSAYIMAYKKPRDENEARLKILSACKRPRFATSVQFVKPIGTKKLRGPSVRFAEHALRVWGNVFLDSQVLYEDDKIRRIKIYATDLETNVTNSTEVVVKKTIERKSKKGRSEDVLSKRENSWGETVYILRATDEEVRIKAAALISIGYRNEGLRLIPKDIIEEAVDIANATLAKQLKKDPEAAKNAVLDAFFELGIKPAEIEKYLGKTVKQTTEADLTDLRGVYRSIKDGETKWSDYYDPDKDKADLQEKVDAVIDITPSAVPITKTKEWKMYQEAAELVGSEIISESFKELKITKGPETKEECLAVLDLAQKKFDAANQKP